MPEGQPPGIGDHVTEVGAGALDMAQTAALPLYTMRGQVTHLQERDFPRLPLVVCREAYLTPPVQGIVSVGATYDSDTGAALRDASQQENLSRARDILPGVLPQDFGQDAPLAAELLAAQLEHEPLPLEASLAAALDPARFLLKSRRGGQV